MKHLKRLIAGLGIVLSIVTPIALVIYLLCDDKYGPYAQGVAIALAALGISYAVGHDYLNYKQHKQKPKKVKNAKSKSTKNT